jgi:hypothetical protein
MMWNCTRGNIDDTELYQREHIWYGTILEVIVDVQNHVEGSGVGAEAFLRPGLCETLQLACFYSVNSGPHLGISYFCVYSIPYLINLHMWAIYT